MKSKKKSSKSLLTRLFKDRKKKKEKGKTAANAAAATSGKKAAKERPLTHKERAVAEIKQMKSLGDKSPERLARILAAMISKEKAKNEAAKEHFDQMVWGIIKRSEKDDEEDDEKPSEN
jgi:hypothetical protein